VPGYSPADQEAARKGQLFSGEQLIDECATLDLLTLVPSVEVPLAVGVGRHDLVNATEVTMEWFERVAAPAKSLHAFEHSAHFPNFCEPDRFQAAVAEFVLGR
jgi:proline iminopeptidase